MSDKNQELLTLHLGSLPFIFGGVRVAYLFSFLCYVVMFFVCLLCVFVLCARMCVCVCFGLRPMSCVPVLQMFLDCQFLTALLGFPSVSLM